MVLSDRAILRHMEAGTITISPFVRANLTTTSYDVALGKWYYRENRSRSGHTIYNPYSQENVAKVWGEQAESAEPAEKWMSEHGPLENIDPADEIIWIAAGETILAHTEEFIGGRETVTTMMKARSSGGRNFINVCKCAGWGDVGYVNRWTMEISNSSRDHTIPLVVGRRYAQIIFFECEPIIEATANYAQSGKYQSGDNLDELRKLWTPDQMLPKMYLDREIRRP